MNKDAKILLTIGIISSIIGISAFIYGFLVVGAFFTSMGSAIITPFIFSKLNIFK